jgi:hypothetical protein
VGTIVTEPDINAEAIVWLEAIQAYKIAYNKPLVGKLNAHIQTSARIHYMIIVVLSSADDDSTAQGPHLADFSLLPLVVVLSSADDDSTAQGPHLADFSLLPLVDA